MITEAELRQLFKNQSDCYADTHKFKDTDVGVTVVEEGDVIQAMTEDRFVEVMKELDVVVSNDCGYFYTLRNIMDFKLMFTLKKNEDAKQWEFEPTGDCIGFIVSFDEADNEADAWVAAWKALILEAGIIKK